MKTKNLEINLTKKFRKMLEEPRSSITATSIKTSKMKILKNKETLLNNLRIQDKVPTLNWYAKNATRQMGTHSEIKQRWKECVEILLYIVEKSTLKIS